MNKRSLKKQSLTDVLLELQIISQEIVSEINLQGEISDSELESYFLESNIISELDLIKAKSVLYECPWIDLRQSNLDPQLVTIIPEKLARRHLLLPVEIREDGLHIAIANPLDVLAIDEVHLLSNKKVHPYMAMPSQILEFIEHFYQMDHQFAHQMIQQFEEETVSSDEIGTTDLTFAEAPIIRLVNHIIRNSFQKRASDIHIEPTREATQIRYRIDGVLAVTERIPQKIHPSLISRIKIMANLDISQHFTPQDGSFSYNYGHRLIDLRISIIPTIFGEKAVIRILNQDTQIIDLEEIGFLEEDLELYKGLLKKHHGIILITGPTGSGKSTTLSSSIKYLALPSINISTVEDPVEYKIDLTNQIQVNEKTGLTFARALRSLLRQDPDILMIGEIRDEETANIAIRAALTGHLVLSSLHTNDAISSISRLKNMGIPGYLISSALIGVVAQRLVRRVCSECLHEITDKLTNQRSPKFKIPPRLFAGKGCSKCNYTGYYGRIGVFEIMPIDEDLKQIIINYSSSSTVYNQTSVSKHLLQDALLKVEHGLTTINEVLRVIV